MLKWLADVRLVRLRLRSLFQFDLKPCLLPRKQQVKKTISFLRHLATFCYCLAPRSHYLPQVTFLSVTRIPLASVQCHSLRSIPSLRNYGFARASRRAAFQSTTDPTNDSHGSAEAWHDHSTISSLSTTTNRTRSSKSWNESTTVRPDETRGSSTNIYATATGHTAAATTTAATTTTTGSAAAAARTRPGSAGAGPSTTNGSKSEPACGAYPPCPRSRKIPAFARSED